MITAGFVSKVKRLALAMVVAGATYGLALGWAYQKRDYPFIYIFDAYPMICASTPGGAIDSTDLIDGRSLPASWSRNGQLERLTANLRRAADKGPFFGAVGACTSWTRVFLALLVATVLLAWLRSLAFRFNRRRRYLNEPEEW